MSHGVPVKMSAGAAASEGWTGAGESVSKTAAPVAVGWRATFSNMGQFECPCEMAADFL